MNNVPGRTCRRTFLMRAASGLGTIALSSALGHAASAQAAPRGARKLLATTDYYDNILGSGRLFDRKQLDGLHGYLASLGVTRHQWIVSTVWNLYDGDESGFDILAEAVKSAHAHGIEFYAEIKPFEGGGFGDAFPPSLPFPEGAIALRGMDGIHPIVRPFVARHPHLCLKRRPGTYEARGPVTAVRLVKGDDQPTRVKAGHLSLWTSPANNRFERYEGPMRFRESVEWRPAYPKTRMCRVLHLEGLELPENHRYFLVRSTLRGDEGDFTNERGNLVELEGPEGANLPCILGTGPVEYELHRQRYLDVPVYNGSYPFQLPSRARIVRRDTGTEHYRDFHSSGNTARLRSSTPSTRKGMSGLPAANRNSCWAIFTRFTLKCANTGSIWCGTAWTGASTASISAIPTIPSLPRIGNMDSTSP